MQHLTVEVSAADGQYLAQAKWDTPRVVKGVRFSLRLTSVRNGCQTGDHRHHRRHGAPFQRPAAREYTLTVRAINSYGQQGEPATTLPDCRTGSTVAD
ncbi:phage tail tip protein J-related protein [Escherichia coli]|uniref:phage tail tip protein J-related protein n=1 Tax=Escherichia coli TaxID=562 RepID=UPI003F515BAB